MEEYLEVGPQCQDGRLRGVLLSTHRTFPFVGYKLILAVGVYGSTPKRAETLIWTTISYDPGREHPQGARGSYRIRGWRKKRVYVELNYPKIELIRLTIPSRVYTHILSTVKYKKGIGKQ